MAINPNFDKTLNSAPMGIPVLAQEEEPLDIQIEDDQGILITLSPDTDVKDSKFDENLAKKLSDQELQLLASELLQDYEADVISRSDWMKAYVEGLKLLGLKYEERTEPWAGACGVTHPLLMESAVKFQSETIMETFPAAGPVRTKIIGKETQDKIDASIRVQEDMNYQLMEVMSEYRPEHERLLISLCLSGNAFKKVYFDPSLGRQTAPFIPAEDIIVPYGATSIESAERVTHYMRKTKNELRRLQVAEFYLDVDLGDPMVTMSDIEKQKAKEQGFTATSDDRFQILEMHVHLDLVGYEDKIKGKMTGIALPYVVTIEKGTAKILAIRRNWLEDDEQKQRRQHFVHYGYIPGFGFYYFGLIHLIGGHAQSATSLLRQLIDAGTLSNLPGGLKAKGLRIKLDDMPIKPGEFRDVDLPSGTIRDNILPLPYKEPSQTLSMLMDRIVEDGRRFAAVSDLNVSDMSAQAPVGTTLAILERVLKVMSAVQARIHYTMKQEFRLLAAIIRDHTPDSYGYEPEVGEEGAKKADYDNVDVLPVSDPNASTMSQRVVQYQAILQLSQTAPQIYDLPFLHRQMIETLGVKNAQKIVPDEDSMKPVDAVTENMYVLKGKPIKAFLSQDHEAHLTIHIAALNDPKIMQIVGQNPQAPALMAAAQSHVMEHVGFQYRKEIEKQLGAALPPMMGEDDDDNEVKPLPPEIEAQLAQLTAKAASKLLQKDIAEAKAQQAAQQAQDPLMQMQQKELEIKAADQQRKTQKDAADIKLKGAELARKTQKDLMDAAAKADESQSRENEVGSRQQLDQAKLIIDAATKADQTEQSKAQHGHKQTMDHMQLGADTHQHFVNTALDHKKHADTLKSQQQAKTQDVLARAMQARMKPANPGQKGKK